MGETINEKPRSGGMRGREDVQVQKNTETT